MGVRELSLAMAEPLHYTDPQTCFQERWTARPALPGGMPGFKEGSVLAWDSKVPGEDRVGEGRFMTRRFDSRRWAISAPRSELTLPQKL
jgi:hypothetical protein